MVDDVQTNVGNTDIMKIFPQIPLCWRWPKFEATWKQSKLDNTKEILIFIFIYIYIYMGNYLIFLLKKVLTVVQK